MRKLSVTINTSKLTLQLEAIAKHAKSLSEELQNIENNNCEDCGGLLINTDDLKDFKTKECQSCGTKYGFPEDK